MLHRRKSSGEFNPEKFLQAETKKNEAFQVSIPRLVVLDRSFKKELLKDLDREHPDIFKPNGTHEEIAIGARQLGRFLRQRLRLEGLRVNREMSHLLKAELVEALALRYLTGKKHKEKPADGGGV